jgi:hypothetical protein
MTRRSSLPVSERSCSIRQGRDLLDETLSAAKKALGLVRGKLETGQPNLPNVADCRFHIAGIPATDHAYIDAKRRQQVPPVDSDSITRVSSIKASRQITLVLAVLAVLLSLFALGIFVFQV